MIRIEQVAAPVVWPVRHRAMYPDKEPESVRLADDAEGVHLALYAGETLVSVISLFQMDGALQFRKFATLPEFQCRGYGAHLLAHVLHYASQRHCNRVWCNARRSAVGFYQKFGFRETGAPFSKNGIEYVAMEIREEKVS